MYGINKKESKECVYLTVSIDVICLLILRWPLVKPAHMYLYITIAHNLENDFTLNIFYSRFAII